ncbi:neural proliferation differentiation and control protein 1 isoform X2 [Octodon degus]|uniref:Neural proliferation differentiation and control protein 1 isoform X2 n=1 Tax=Octodon degus TaxID=10160 RepID=A0A6P6D7Y3_OCTDE|nr:neural proliferation differentiation and control protein 1 isoform X2 [Octodon degus]
MATPVPPPAPRHLRLLRLLLSGLVLGAALTGTTASRPGAIACPGSLDCALKRRARCPPGARACGPCLQHFQEDPHGLCVPRTHQPRGQGLPPPRLEDDIDLLAQELAVKEAGHSQLELKPVLEDRPGHLEPVTLVFSERGQRPESGLPSPQGAPTPTPRASWGSPLPSGPVHMVPLEPQSQRGDGLTLVLLVVFCVSGAGALAVATLCWCRLRRDIHLTQKADYCAAKVPGSPRTPRISPGDQRLAHSAEMYHYQHQRQQMLSLEREDPVIPPSSRHKEPPKELESVSSDEENEDGDFTVYECPGLAPTGEMEVRNPLFDHSSLPAPPPEPRSSPSLP